MNIKMKSREGPVTVKTAVCLKCMTPNAEVTVLAPGKD